MLLDLIKNRKSVREYTEQKISKEDLTKILEAGYYAPSWMNSQPWKFIAVENQETKDMLCELSGHQPHVKNASALICCVADKNGWSKEEFGEVLAGRGIGKEGQEKIFSIPMFYPVLLGEDKVLMRSVEQVTYAVSYMMLTAKEMGIDSCIIGALQNEATVIKNPELFEKEFGESLILERYKKLKDFLTTTNITEETAPMYKLPVGALILEITEGSPADKAGLEVGDVITQFNGQTVMDMDSLVKMVNEARIGSTVDMYVIRDGKDGFELKIKIEDKNL